VSSAELRHVADARRAGKLDERGGDEASTVLKGEREKPRWNRSTRAPSEVAVIRGASTFVPTRRRRLLILPRFGGLVDYAANAAICDLNSNSIGLT
jgi:hypothetical protein